jgi:Fur family ferric uptake transcriptional regulator
MKRNTMQREVLKHTIEQAKRPLSVAEIHALAIEQAPRLGIATVYREIKRLHDDGALKRVDIPGETAPRYETPRSHGRHHHHHFKCKSCNKVFDIETCTLNIESLLPAGFRHQEHDITIFGRCASC